MERILILLLYISLAGIAGIHKVLGDFPPVWFFEKFKSSFLNWVPGGIWFSFVLIVVLEIAIAVLFSIALIKGEFKAQAKQTFSYLGFITSLTLFVILFFGSFLVQDYDNGFNDFVYFGVTVFLMNYFTNEKIV
ncbi:MAG: hypothetical protein EBQ94_03575 [Flavobacteriales bacterium]|nr:hypothetical protein [Flavobacteriales bacterium]NCA20053.1 hypothetical protein [Crocinitomicaceae bacterium]